MRTFFFLTITIICYVSLAIGQNTKFNEKVLLTSAGQSADTKLVGMVLKKAQIQTLENNSAKSSDLTGISTLIIVPGFSSKGLGAAGISQDQEMNRVKELITAAKQKNIPILCLHVGGNARRKGQSDDFNKYVGEASKEMIIVKQGDEDKFFSDIAKQKNIPITLVDKIVDISEPLKKLFGKQ